MFETQFARPRRSGPMTAAVAFHALLGGFLLVPPLVAFPESPDASDKVRIPAFFVPQPDVPVRVETVKHHDSGGDTPKPGPVKRPASGTPRPVDVQPPAIPSVLPSPSAVAPPEEPQGPGDGPYIEAADPNAPKDGTGRVGNGLHSGEDTDPIVPGPDVTMPVPISTPEPTYPEWARRAHLQGVVLLEAVIGNDGRVRDVRVIRSLNPGLDRVCEDVVKTWRYQPARVGGRTVSIYLTVSLRFSLT